jgi:hypothetical protein
LTGRQRKKKEERVINEEKRKKPEKRKERKVKSTIDMESKGVDRTGQEKKDKKIIRTTRTKQEQERFTEVLRVVS